MRLIVQRCLESAVSVENSEISRIGKGMMILLGITPGDNSELVKKYVSKVLKLRIWPEIQKKTEATPIQDLKEGDKPSDSNEEKKISDDSDSTPTPTSKGPKTWDSNVVDNGFDIMVVSQFTLYGVLKGNKPDFHLALNPDEAVKLYNEFVDLLKKNYKEDRVKSGKFGEYMHVHLINDGPVTLILDSDKDPK